MTSRRLALFVPLAVALAAGGGCDDAKTPKPGAATKAGEGADYDPATDPLVNTKAMTEPYDAARCAEDETFVSTLDGNPQTLMPVFASSQYEQRLEALLWDGPFTFDANMEWKVNYDFAEKLDVSADQRTWTLKIKKDRTWQDGVPFTAHDFAWSWKEVWMNPDVPVVDRDQVSRLESVTALDDWTVQYVVKEPTPMSKWDVNFTVVPQHVYEKGKAQDTTLKSSPYFAELARKPIGSGPYRVVEWKENDKIVCERWEGYKGPKPHFKKVVFRIIPDQNVQLLTFEKGETDEMRLMSKQFAVETVRSDTFKELGHKSKSSQWSYNFICWNIRTPFFSDVRVRRAMTMAMNLPQMMEKITYRLGEPTYGPFHKTSWMFNPETKLLPYDTEGAAKLLDEAGWKIDPESGWRTKDGAPFSFTMNFGQGNAQTLEMLAIIQQTLKSLGVEMKLQPLEWATLQQRNRSHEIQASTLAWGTGVDPALNKNIFGTAAIADGRNYGCYSNPKLDELFLAGEKEFDQEKRKRIYQEIGKIVYDDQPYTFLWSMPCLWAFHKRIRGVTYSPRGVWGFDPSLSGWWVSKEEQLYK